VRPSAGKFDAMTTSMLDLKTKSGVAFGKELREKEFSFGREWLNLNHGKSIMKLEPFPSDSKFLGGLKTFATLLPHITSIRISDLLPKIH
jgi:hypothetical protein